MYTGLKVRLVTPYLGYTQGEIVDQCGYKWLIRLESGLEITLYIDEFYLC